MVIIGCDYHPSFQQIAFVDTETGDIAERRLLHREEAEQFYRKLKDRGLHVRVGMEASGHARWFERLLHDLEFELWIGNAAEIRTKRVRKQKTDRQDAQLLLRLMMEDRFPQIWVADAENRDLRQLLWHRHRLVQMRTRVMNQLHVVALNEGLRRKKALWRPAGRRELESLVLAPWARRRRQDLLDLLDRLTSKIQELTHALEAEVKKRSVTRQLMTHPGVGPLTALAFELVIGTPERFHCGKQIASLCGIGSRGRVQRRSATIGTYQQTGQLTAALSAGGSSPGHGAQPTAVAQQVLPPCPAPWTEDRQGCDGPKAGGASVLDVASGLGLRAVQKFRFARGRARKSPWRAVNRRRNDWVSRSPEPGEFEQVIMIEVVIEEMAGSN
jgi:transposase